MTNYLRFLESRPTEFNILIIYGKDPNKEWNIKTHLAFMLHSGIAFFRLGWLIGKYLKKKKKKQLL